MLWIPGVLGGLFVLIFLILSVRLRLIAQYDRNGPKVIACAGPVRVQVYPRPEEGPEDEKKKRKLKKEPEKTPKKGGAVDKFRAGLSVIGPMFGQVKRRLTISELTLYYTISTDDAAKTAMLYGGANLAVAQMLPMIRHHFRVKKQDMQIRADFTGGEDHILLRVKLTLSVWGAMRLGIFTLKKLRESGLIQKGETHGQAYRKASHQ